MTQTMSIGVDVIGAMKNLKKTFTDTHAFVVELLQNVQVMMSTMKIVQVQQIVMIHMKSVIHRTMSHLVVNLRMKSFLGLMNKKNRPVLQVVYFS